MVDFRTHLQDFIRAEFPECGSRGQAAQFGVDGGGGGGGGGVISRRKRTSDQRRRTARSDAPRWQGRAERPRLEAVDARGRPRTYMPPTAGWDIFDIRLDGLGGTKVEASVYARAPHSRPYEFHFSGSKKRVRLRILWTDLFGPLPERLSDAPSVPWLELMIVNTALNGSTQEDLRSRGLKWSIIHNGCDGGWGAF